MCADNLTSSFGLFSGRKVFSSSSWWMLMALLFGRHVDLNMTCRWSAATVFASACALTALEDNKVKSDWHCYRHRWFYYALIVQLECHFRAILITSQINWRDLWHKVRKKIKIKLSSLHWQHYPACHTLHFPDRSTRGYRSVWPSLIYSSRIIVANKLIYALVLETERSKKK